MSAYHNKETLHRDGMCIGQTLTVKLYWKMIGVGCHAFTAQLCPLVALAMIGRVCSCSSPLV